MCASTSCCLRCEIVNNNMQDRLLLEAQNAALREALMRTAAAADAIAGAVRCCAACKRVGPAPWCSLTSRVFVLAGRG